MRKVIDLTQKQTIILKHLNSSGLYITKLIMFGEVLAISRRCNVFIPFKRFYKISRAINPQFFADLGNSKVCFF